MAAVGDELDALVRKGQDNQTMGIPIGPDTSFILSELVLSACDEELTRRFAALRGLRYFDDYEFPFHQPAEAESMLASLQAVLLEYELRLNPRKTSVQMPPIEFESEWVRDTRAFRFRNTASGQAGDLIGYFDLITQYMRRLPDEHVAKYAISRLVDSKFVPLPSNRELYQSLLCQIATAEPGSIREVLMSLIYIGSNRAVLDLALISETITSIILRHAPLGHHYEVAWSIWAAITLGIPLEPAAVAAISKVDNSVVAILALDARSQNLAANLDTTLWEPRMCEAELSEEQWLLSYEANLHGWLPTVGGGDHVAADPNFAVLKNAGVHFYESLVPIAMPVIAWAGYGNP